VFHVKQPAPLCPDVSRETLEKLTIFVDLLLKWSATINLVSRADLPHLWPRHVADSLQLLPLLPTPAQTLIDLGSGGGFPGLVLALASDWHVELIEADRRKAAFLREAVRATGAHATVHATRIEDTMLPLAAAVTARALAPLPQLIALAAPKLRPDGIGLFMKGRNTESELTSAQKEWHMAVRQIISHTDPLATILRITDIRRIPPKQ
jgi:16S rRNA (guanine527-N7)-methyltransferase